MLCSAGFLTRAGKAVGTRERRERLGAGRSADTGFVARVHVGNSGDGGEGVEMKPGDKKVASDTSQKDKQ